MILFFVSCFLPLSLLHVAIVKVSGMMTAEFTGVTLFDDGDALDVVEDQDISPETKEKV